MEILILSDLHLEFAPFYPPNTTADVIVLAGDIWLGDKAVLWARQTWPKLPIVYVAGNHEFYKNDRDEVLDSLRLSAKNNDVYFLDNEEVTINGVRFLGSTLWTDFNLFGHESQAKCVEVANEFLNDFRLISQNGKRFTPKDSLKLHIESTTWLREKLIDENFSGDTVVVTHHCPSWLSVAERYQNSPLSACFASRLDDLMGYSKFWIHGHTHDSFDYEIEGTRVICNPRGYVRHKAENLDFAPYKIITI